MTNATNRPKFNQPLRGNEMPRFGGPSIMMRLPAQPPAEGARRFRLGPRAGL